MRAAVFIKGNRLKQERVHAVFLCRVIKQLVYHTAIRIKEVNSQLTSFFAVCKRRCRYETILPFTAISGTDISMAQLEETNPVITDTEDLLTHRTDYSVTKGMPLRITGRRLKIAGDGEKIGLFLAPQQEDGSISKEESDWIHVESQKFFENTVSYLEFILPDALKSSTKYTLVLRTAWQRQQNLQNAEDACL